MMNFAIKMMDFAMWKVGTAAEPHITELAAAVDNMAEPLELPLAPWS